MSVSSFDPGRLESALDLVRDAMEVLATTPRDERGRALRRAAVAQLKATHEAFWAAQPVDDADFYRFFGSTA